MARRPIARRARPPVLVGRESELERLRQAMLAPPAVVVVAGEAGVGKTRLVAEAVERAESHGYRTLVGRSHPSGTPFPYGVLIDALRRLGPLPGLDSPGLAAWWQHVPELQSRIRRCRSGPIAPPDDDLVTGLVDLLERLGPVVLVLEDLQWCDSCSAALLRCLVPRLPADSALILSRRAPGPDSSPLARLAGAARRGTTVELVTMPPLDVTTVRELAVALSSCDVSEELAAALWARTGGLPRLVELVMRQLSSASDKLNQQGVDVGGFLASLDIPEDLADDVLSDLAPYGPDALRAAGAVSVLRSPSDTTAVAAVSGLPVLAVSRALRSLVAGGILTGGGPACRFRSPLVSQAVYDSIPGPERRRYHRAAAAWLSSKRDRSLAELARHHREGGDVGAWVRAVDMATADLSAPQAAVELLRDVVLQPSLSPGLRSRLAVRLGTAAQRAEMSAVARPPLQRVVDELGLSGVCRADVRWSLGCLHLAVGDADGWRDQRVAAARDLRHLPGRAALVMMELAMPWVEHGRLDEHRLWLERAAEAARHQSDPVVTLCVAVATALVPLYVGDPSGWEAMDAIPWDATSPAEQLQLAWAMQNLGGACFHLGHYDRARRLYQDGLRRVSDLERHDRAHVFRAADLSLAWCTGDWEGLDAAARTYIREFSDLPGWTLHGKLVLGHLQLARGELEEAERLLGDAVQAAHEAGAIPVVASAAGGLARISLARGEPEAARSQASEAVVLLARKGIWAWAAPVAPPAVEAMIACGRAREATELIGRFRDGLAGRDAPLARAALELCEGMTLAAVGDHALAEVRLGEAVRSFEGLPRPHDAAVAMALRGHSLMESGDPRGPDVLRSALALLECLDASADAARVRRALRRRAVAVPRPWRGGRSGYGSRLSPRQQEVVDLTMAGRTNDEIARALFISQKTVEDHLRVAIQKLGVASKRELRHSAAAIPHRSSGSHPIT